MVYRLNLIQAQVQRSLLRMTAFDAQTRYLPLKKQHTMVGEDKKNIVIESEVSGLSG